MSTNEFNIQDIRYVWDLERGLPIIRRFLILKIQFAIGEIYYTGCFQYDDTGDPENDYGCCDKEYRQDDVFKSLQDARQAALMLCKKK